jgi:hypothetical protein
MRKQHWVDQMTNIARDFEDAHVRAFLFKRIGGRVTCLVTVVNADGKEVTWELVDDGVSADLWRKVDG